MREKHNISKRPVIIMYLKKTGKLEEWDPFFQADWLQSNQQ